ncbi:GNAT family N-acetyltransferase [Mesobacterium sp. TK19101]|uniref:GNAT family N-acetyltransferase n=1 Tax=Mesobacterium hydrothermale TaxID=3111907 RepID=A0ABU6HBW7_9RHOB|nr:GNAT family N-acetyltransferase [Mesobacterium sp. TK19101]MEC3859967.1 GNAT family N-acetyltransferase [Mesobacterium sp. TK19101]
MALCSTPSLSIRPGGPADLAAVDALLTRSYPALLAQDYTPEVLALALPVICRAQPHLVTCGSYFLAHDGPELVAAGGWTPNAPQGRAGPAHIGHIRHVVTDHRRVRQGVGRRLLTHAMADARAQGIRVLHCHSTLTAEPFYAALGFRKVAAIDLRLRPGVLFPATHMVADIAA